MKTNISVQCELMKSRLPNRLVHDVTGRKRSAGSLNSARPGFSQLRSFEALPLFFPFLYGRFGASSLSQCSSRSCGFIEAFALLLHRGKRGNSHWCIERFLALAGQSQLLNTEICLSDYNICHYVDGWLRSERKVDVGWNWDWEWAERRARGKAREVWSWSWSWSQTIWIWDSCCCCHCWEFRLFNLKRERERETCRLLSEFKLSTRSSLDLDYQEITRT